MGRLLDHDSVHAPEYARQPIPMTSTPGETLTPLGEALVIARQWVNGAEPSLEGRNLAQALLDLHSLVSSERGTNAEFSGDVRKIVSDWGADDVGVERFAKAMSAKLAKKRDEGRGGWNREPYTVQPDRGDRVERLGCTVAGLRKMLREHFESGDPVDIANFCMMIWNRENPNG
jgi:hypothetical protein